MVLQDACALNGHFSTKNCLKIVFFYKSVIDHNNMETIKHSDSHIALPDGIRVNIFYN